MKKNRWLYILMVLAIGVVLSTLVSFAMSIAWLTPILGAAVAYPVFIYLIYHQRYRTAAISMLLWAVFLSLAVGIGTTWFPESAAEAILSGPAYVDRMFNWIQTGEGYGDSLQVILPSHVRNYLIFCGLCCLTLSSTALLFGTWQLNYMNFYVAELIRASVHPWGAIAVGWPPWSVLRVIGYILTGVALAVVGLSQIDRLRSRPVQRPFPQQYLWLGMGFVMADIMLKAPLAPLWRGLLRYVLLGEAG
ncbi:MAG: hypothetical protein AAF152_13860 [Cyanobacteria bacterium P01_A01_bin.114]